MPHMRVDIHPRCRPPCKSAFLFIAFAFASPASPGIQVHAYTGRDRTNWSETVSSATPLSSGTAALYAGGEYNVSIAKTTVDAAGNLYAIGSQLVTIGSYTAHTIFVTKIDATGATVYITRLGRVLANRVVNFLNPVP